MYTKLTSVYQNVLRLIRGECRRRYVAWKIRALIQYLDETEPDCPGTAVLRFLLQMFTHEDLFVILTTIADTIDRIQSFVNKGETPPAEVVCYLVKAMETFGRQEKIRQQLADRLEGPFREVATAIQMTSGFNTKCPASLGAARSAPILNPLLSSISEAIARDRC